MSYFTQVKILGNTGGILDAVIGAAVPANALQVGGSDGTDLYALPLASGGGSIVASNTGTFVVQASITTLGQQLAAASVPVVLTALQITALTPPTAAAIGTAVSGDLLIGTQLAAASVPVALPTATITTLTPPTAAAIAAAIVANPPTVGISGTVAATQSGTWTVGISAAQTIAVTNVGTFAVQATLSAETTKVIGTVNQGTSPWIVAGGGTAGTAATGVVTVQGIAAMTPLLVTASFAAAQHVIVDSGTITAVTAITNALPAGTNVIGHVIADSGSTTAVTGVVEVAPTGAANTLSNPFFNVLADNSGHALTVNSTATASKYALDTNILSILGTAPTTAGFLDIKGADGNVFVRSNDASTFPVTADIVGHAGVVLDAVLGATKPANVLQVGGNDGTNAYAIPLISGGGSVVVSAGQATQTLPVWNSSNFISNFNVVLAQNTGVPAILVQLDQVATLTTGVMAFAGTYDGINWVALGVNQILDPTTAAFASISSSYNFVAGQKKAFLILMGGYQQIRAQEVTPITGNGTVTAYVTQLAYAPVGWQKVQGDVSPGSTPGTNPVRIAGTDGALTPAIRDVPVCVSGAASSLNVLQVGGVDGLSNTYPIPLSSGGGKLLATVDAITLAAAQTLATVTTVGTVSTVTTVTNPVKIEGNGGATLDAAINTTAPTNAVWTTNAPATAAAAALTPKSIASTAQAVLKASAGNLYGLMLLNLAEVTTTSTVEVMYIHFFNTTTTTSLSTTNWLFNLPIPASTTGSLGNTGQANPLCIPPGLLALANFSSGIVIVINTTSASNTTASGTAPVGVVWVQ